MTTAVSMVERVVQPLGSVRGGSRTRADRRAGRFPGRALWRVPRPGRARGDLPAGPGRSTPGQRLALGDRDRRGRVHPVRERRPHRGAARHQHEGDGHRRGTPARRGVLRGRHPPRPGRCPGVGDVSRHPPAAVAGAGPATGADRGRRRRLGRPRPVRPPRQRGRPRRIPAELVEPAPLRLLRLPDRVYRGGRAALPAVRRRADRQPRLVVAVAAAFAAAGYIGLVVATRPSRRRAQRWVLGLAGRHDGRGALAFQPLRACRRAARRPARLRHPGRAVRRARRRSVAGSAAARRPEPCSRPSRPRPAQAVAAERAVVRLDVDAGADLVEVWPPGAAVPDETTGQVVPVADAARPAGLDHARRPGRSRRPRRSSSGCSRTSPTRPPSPSATSGCRSSSRPRSSSSTSAPATWTRRAGRLIDAADTERRRLESALAREVLPAMDSLRTDLADGPARVDEATAASYVDARDGRARRRSAS